MTPAPCGIETYLEGGAPPGGSDWATAPEGAWRLAGECCLLRPNRSMVAHGCSTCGTKQVEVWGRAQAPITAPSFAPGTGSLAGSALLGRRPRRAPPRGDTGRNGRA